MRLKIGQIHFQWRGDRWPCWIRFRLFPRASALSKRCTVVDTVSEQYRTPSHRPAARSARAVKSDGKAHQACRLRPIVAQTSCISTFYSHMSQNVELAARPIELEFDQRPLYRRQISFGERPGEAFLLPVMTYHGHVSPPQLPTPILSRIGVEVVRSRPDPLRTVFRSHFRLRAKLTRETAILVRRCFVKLSRTL